MTSTTDKRGAGGPGRFVAALGRTLALAMLALLVLVTTADRARAVPPGQNGAIVVGSWVDTVDFKSVWETYLMGPNGEDVGPLGVDGFVTAVHPAGKSIAVKRNDSSARDLYDFEGNKIRGLGTKPINDFSPDGTLALSNTLGVDHELTILDLETDQVTPLGVLGDGGEFTPDGKKIIFQRTWSPSFGVTKYGIFKVNVDGSGETLLLETGVLSGLSVSPDGTKIAFGQYTGGASDVWMMGIDGSDPARVTNAAGQIDYGWPQFSPDGAKIVAEKRFYDDSTQEAVVMDIAGGGEHAVATEAEIPGSNYRPYWVPVASTLDLKLEARGVDDGDDFFDVVMRLRAGNQSAVENLRFTDPEIIGSSAAGFPEEERSEVVKVSGPDGPIPNRLEVNEERTLVWTYKVTKPGRVALYSEVTADAVKDGVPETDGHTVIADSVPTEEESDTDGEITPQLATLGAMDNWLVKSYEAWLDGNDAEARRIVRWAKKHLSAKKRKVLLGAKNKIKVSRAEEAFADRANLSPKLAAAVMPDPRKAKKLGLKNKAPSTFRVTDAFLQGYFDEIGRQGKRDIGKGWKKVKDGFVASVALFNYLNGDASPEERAQIEAMAMNTWTLAEGRAQIDWDSAQGKRVLARYGGSLYRDHIGVPVNPIRAEDVNAMWNDITLQTEDLQAQLNQEKIKLKNIYKGGNILKSARKHGAMVGDESYPWVKIGAETMVGAGSERVAGKVLDEATGLIRLGKSEGEITAAGKSATKPKTTVAHEPIGSTGARPSVRDTVISRRTFDGETLDELENIGGIPKREAEIQREIIAEIESEFGLPEGQIGLALKPSSPLRKPNSVAKFELAKVKTGKPIHERLGMHPKGLSEPTFFKPKNPKKLPEWDRLSATEQSDLLKTYKKAKREYKDWTSGSPKDRDLAKLSKATQRAGGPEITEPVTIDLGQGRTARAIFEEAPVGGGDTIRIRVKYYEVDGIVFVNSKKARPMGPDLDAVAIYDAKNGTRLSDRQLETKILRAYRKKVAERVKSGERFHGAEHGMTLIMDDVPAGPNGSVGFLMQYGIPFLPEEAAYSFARRIEAYVEMLAEEIVGNVGKPNSGAFGQELVNVTSTDVYYGKLPVSEW